MLDAPRSRSRRRKHGVHEVVVLAEQRRGEACAEQLRPALETDGGAHSRVDPALRMHLCMMTAANAHRSGRMHHSCVSLYPFLKKVGGNMCDATAIGPLVRRGGGAPGFGT